MVVKIAGCWSAGVGAEFVVFDRVRTERVACEYVAAPRSLVWSGSTDDAVYPPALLVEDVEAGGVDGEVHLRARL